MELSANSETGKGEEAGPWAQERAFRTLKLWKIASSRCPSTVKREEKIGPLMGPGREH